MAPLLLPRWGMQTAEDTGILAPLREFQRRHPGLAAFATWLGAAEMTVIGVMLLILSHESMGVTPRELVRWIYWSGLVGAMMGFIPALVAGAWARGRGRPSRLWLLVLTSVLVTLLTGAGLGALLLRAVGGC